MPIPASSPVPTRSATPFALSQELQALSLDRAEHSANSPISEQVNFPHARLASLTAHTQRSIPPSPTNISEAPYTTHANHVITPAQHTPLQPNTTQNPTEQNPASPTLPPSYNNLTVLDTPPSYISIGGTAPINNEPAAINDETYLPMTALESSARPWSTTQPFNTFNITSDLPKGEKYSLYCFLLFLFLLLPSTVTMLCFTDFDAESISYESDAFAYSFSVTLIFFVFALFSLASCTYFYCSNRPHASRQEQNAPSLERLSSNNRATPIIQRLLSLIRSSNSSQ